MVERPEFHSGRSAVRTRYFPHFNLFFFNAFNLQAFTYFIILKYLPIFNGSTAGAFN